MQQNTPRPSHRLSRGIKTSGAKNSRFSGGAIIREMRVHLKIHAQGHLIPGIYMDALCSVTGLMQDRSRFIGDAGLLFLKQSAATRPLQQTILLVHLIDWEHLDVMSLACKQTRSVRQEGKNVSK